MSERERESERDREVFIEGLRENYNERVSERADNNRPSQKRETVAYREKDVFESKSDHRLQCNMKISRIPPSLFQPDTHIKASLSLQEYR